jgi:tRNA 5-methylaminomethyl-2-thiouridine biosynthesis bifunctional protein
MALTRPKGMSRQLPKSIAIIGAGLAGAACANAFAHKGYSVVVYEQASASAAGASGVPIAMFAPSISSDDAPHSRLLRSGVHLLLDELHRLTDDGLLTEGADWAMTGVLERCLRGDKKLPSTWLEPQDPLGLQSRVLGEPYTVRPAGHTQEILHGSAGWVNPKRLIAAWLAHPNIQLRAGERIDDFKILDDDVIVAALGYQTPLLVSSLKAHLQPIRGQVEWGNNPVRAESDEAEVAFPINGMGHFIQTPSAWVAGATFQRDETDLTPRAKDVDLNFEKLKTLLPELGKAYRIRLREKSTSWVGVRVAQKNRQPLIIQPDASGHPQLWVCTGLGSRGLSLAALCASTLLSSVQHRFALG